MTDEELFEWCDHYEQVQTTFEALPSLIEDDPGRLHEALDEIMSRLQVMERIVPANATPL